jgi:hypothetical protein
MRRCTATLDAEELRAVGLVALVSQQPPRGEDDGARDDGPDAERLEQEWAHALETAGGAVNASNRAGAITAENASEASRHIDDQRKWLHSFKPTLRKLFPLRRRRDGPPDTS